MNIFNFLKTIKTCWYQIKKCCIIFQIFFSLYDHIFQSLTMKNGSTVSYFRKKHLSRSARIENNDWKIMFNIGNPKPHLTVRTAEFYRSIHTPTGIPIRSHLLNTKREANQVAIVKTASHLLEPFIYKFLTPSKKGNCTNLARLRTCEPIRMTFLFHGRTANWRSHSNRSTGFKTGYGCVIPFFYIPSKVIQRVTNYY